MTSGNTLAWDKAAVIIEPRSHPCLGIAIRSVLHYLGDGWGLQIFHGPDNLDYIIEALTTDCSRIDETGSCTRDMSVLENVELCSIAVAYETVRANVHAARARRAAVKAGRTPLPVVDAQRLLPAEQLWPEWLMDAWFRWEAEMDARNAAEGMANPRGEWSLVRRVYSQILLSPSFWRSVQAETVLVFQTDAFLCRTGIDAVANSYDYAGAPWYLCEKGRDRSSYLCEGGNGGLSLRRRSNMLRLASSGKRCVNLRSPCPLLILW
jgi:hypothetical protein